MTAEQVIDRRPATLVGNVIHFDFCDGREQFRREVIGGAARRVIERSGTRFGERDERLQGIRGQRRVHHEHVGRACQQGHRREVPDRVVWRVVQTRIDGVRTRCRQERVAVRRGSENDLGADDRGGTWPVLNDHRLFPAFLQLLAYQTRNGRRCTACRKGHDQPHGFCRIVFVCARTLGKQTQHADQRELERSIFGHGVLSPHFPWWS